MTTTDDSDTAGERERLREWIKVVARRQAGGKTHTAFVFIKPHAVYEKARINSGLWRIQRLKNQSPVTPVSHYWAARWRLWWKKSWRQKGCSLAACLDGCTGVRAKRAKQHLCLKLNSLYEVEEVGGNTPCCMIICRWRCIWVWVIFSIFWHTRWQMCGVYRCMWAGKGMDMNVYRCLLISTCIYVLYLHICMHMYMYIYMSTYAYVHVHAYVFVYVYVFAAAFANVYWFCYCYCYWCS